MCPVSFPCGLFHDIFPTLLSKSLLDVKLAMVSYISRNEFVLPLKFSYSRRVCDAVDLKSKPSGLEFHEGHGLHCPGLDLGTPYKCSHRHSVIVTEIQIIQWPCPYQNEIPGLKLCKNFHNYLMKIYIFLNLHKVWLTNIIFYQWSKDSTIFSLVSNTEGITEASDSEKTEKLEDSPTK